MPQYVHQFHTFIISVQHKLLIKKPIMIGVSVINVHVICHILVNKELHRTSE